jgi:outer membrane protein assembly factor BamB
MGADPPSRRRVLSLLGAAALAGCSAPATSGTTDDVAGTSPTDGTDRTKTTTTAPPTTTDTTAAPNDQPPAPPGSGGDWTMSGLDLANTGYNPDAAGPGGAVRRVWQTDVEGIYTMAQPTVADGTVFVASGTEAYAMAARTGDLSWTTQVDHLGHFYPVAVGENAAFVGTRTLAGSNEGGGEGTLYALDRDDGSTRWRVDAPITSPVKPAGDTVFYASSTGPEATVHAAAADSGEDRWTASVSGETGYTLVTGAPALTDDTVFVTATVDGGAGNAEDGVLVAFDRADGTERWRAPLHGAVTAAPVLSGETIFVGTQEGAMTARRRDDGGERWTTETDSRLYTTPVTDGDAVYALLQGEVVSLGADDGGQRWRTDVGSTLINGLALTDDRVYVGGKAVRSLDVADGSVTWEFPIPKVGGGYGAPIVLGETVFVGACIKDSMNSRYDDYMFALQRA